MELAVLNMLMTFSSISPFPGDAGIKYRSRIASFQLKILMTEVRLVGKTEILKDFALPTFSKVQLTLTDSLKTLGIILDITLLLKKQLHPTP